MLKILSATFLMIFLLSCAEKPGGIFVMNEETIENFFERDKQSWNPPSHLNLLLDQPVVNAEIPPVPAGYTRIYGTLSSSGKYTYTAKNTVITNRGSDFTDSVFGKLGPAGKNGNAWFYADFNPATSQITDARAYIYGFMGGVCDMRNKTKGTYGQITPDGFILNINGPCLFPDVSGSTAGYGLVAHGQKLDGLNYNLQYIIDDTPKITQIPANSHESSAIFDSGLGKAWIN